MATLTVDEVNEAMQEVTLLLERYQDTRNPRDLGRAMGALDSYRIRYGMRT